MFNFDPIHYIAAGSLIIVLILGIYSYTLNLKLDACEASQHATVILGKAQEAETKREDRESKRNQKEANKYYEDVIARNTADNERLRKQIARGRLLPTAPQICSEGATRTTIDWPLIEQAIKDYRQEVGNLIEKGDKNTAGLNSVKEWYDKEQD